MPAERGATGMRSRAPLPLLMLLALLGAMALAVPARAAVQIEEFETTTSSSLAGEHPDLHTYFKLADPGAPEVAKDIRFDLPSGYFGNPSVLTPCTPLDFALQQCPPNSQTGLITIRASREGDPDFLLGTAPVYSLEPGPEEAARFSFIAPVLDVPISIPVTVRSAVDYGLRFTVSGITQLTPLSSADITFWGFPGDATHEAQRFPKGSPGSPAGCPELADASCNPSPTQASVPPRPFTGNPSICGKPMPTTLAVESYQDPGVFSEAKSSYPEIEKCERQTFQPVAAGKLTTDEADSPSGMDFEFSIPQAQQRAASPSQLRASTFVLPEGLTINPDAADGQTACSDSDAGLGREGPVHCPDSSKVGTVSLGSESLPGPLRGAIYFAQPVPGNQYRLLLAADGYGIHAKLIGRLLPDEKTGQVTARFDDLPQLPLEHFSLHLFASDRGVFATPIQCSVYTVSTDLFPWNSVLPDETSQFIVSVGRGPGGEQCPGGTRPFEPRLNAGTSNSKAGGFSDFTLKLDRDDGDQYLGDLNFTMPPGLLASLRGITYCPEAAISAAAAKLGRDELAAPSCPDSSLIGTTNAAAGPGTHPFNARGRIYMGGPFAGSPLSLVAITPALAGPYDYGTQVVRVAIGVDPVDAHVTAVSDTIPSILGGVPLRMRSLQVNLDRPRFMINPTNCEPMSVGSQGIGDEGTVADFSSYFQAVDCADLPFRPRMTIRQLDRNANRRAKDPRLEFRLRTRDGDANIKSVAVTLPKAIAIDQRHLRNICSESELAATKCAGRGAIGTASAKTPLLDRPLSGKVYAVSGAGGLPRLAFVLEGQVPVTPRATTTGNGGRLKTVVPIVPDAKIGDFRLRLYGGKLGYLINSRNLCPKRPTVRVHYVAQNGKHRTESVRIKAGCRKAKRKR